MTRISTVLLFVAAMGSISLTSPASDKPRKMNVRVWDATTRDGTTNTRFTFPEASLPELAGKRDVGIALSGGGSRAALAACGQIRALRAMGVMDKVGCLSAISGGTWFALPFVYARPEHSLNPVHHSWSQEQYDDLLLGRYIPPEHLTAKDLNKAEGGSFAHAIGNINLTYFHLFLHQSGDESYASAINRGFLEPFGLGDKTRFMGWSQQQFEREIRPQNPGLKQEHFYFAAPGRPYLIANTALERRQRTKLTDKLLLMTKTGIKIPIYSGDPTQGFWHTELTPIYSGTTVHSAPDMNLNPLTWFEQHAGGGYTQTFGYDSRFLKWLNEDKTLAEVRRSYQLWPGAKSEFSLADAMAASGSAPAAFVGDVTDVFGYRPEFIQWHFSSDKPNRDEAEYGHVDGGACDNLGIIALVKRRTPKIIALLNSVEEFPEVDPKHPERSNGSVKALPTLLTSLFGEEGRDNWRNALGQAVTNHVFSNKNGELDRIAADLARANARHEPLICFGDYTTTCNTRYGVDAGQKVSVCWVYLVPAKLGTCECNGPVVTNTHLDSWINKIGKASGSEALQEIFSNREHIKSHKLKSFPAYNILGEDPSSLLRVNPLQANALAHFSGFSVMQAKSRILAWLKK